MRTSVKRSQGLVASQFLLVRGRNLRLWRHWLCACCGR